MKNNTQNAGKFVIINELLGKIMKSKNGKYEGAGQRQQQQGAYKMFEIYKKNRRSQNELYHIAWECHGASFRLRRYYKNKMKKVKRNANMATKRTKNGTNVSLIFLNS